jgi:hypothetical protein
MCGHFSLPWVLIPAVSEQPQTHHQIYSVCTVTVTSYHVTLSL